MQCVCLRYIILLAASLNIQMEYYSGVIFASKLHFSIFHLERAFFLLTMNEDFKIVNEVELLFHVTYYNTSLYVYSKLQLFDTHIYIPVLNG